MAVQLQQAVGHGGWMVRICHTTWLMRLPALATMPQPVH
jgi:hypothetical protein